MNWVLIIITANGSASMHDFETLKQCREVASVYAMEMLGRSRTPTYSCVELNPVEKVGNK